MIAFVVSASFAAQAATPPPADTPAAQQQIVVVGRRPVTADRIALPDDRGDRLADFRGASLSTQLGMGPGTAEEPAGNRAPGGELARL